MLTASIGMSVLGNGQKWGVSFDHIVQDAPNGLAGAYIIAEPFLNGHHSAMILGDNSFYGDGSTGVMAYADAKTENGTVFGYRISDHGRDGVVGLDYQGNAVSLVKNPSQPASKYAFNRHEGIIF